MGVNITRAVGQLNRTTPTDDAVVCMVFSGAAVATKIALAQPVQIFGTAGLETFGITNANNPVAFRDITDFYSAAGEGAEFNFMLVSDTTLLADICNVANAFAKKLLDFVEGRGVILLVNVKRAVGYELTLLTGLDADVWGAVTKMQALAVSYQNANLPFVGILPGLGFAAANVATLPLRSTLANDNVAVSFACEKADGFISMGLLAGCLAARQVHRNLGRVLDGKVADTGFYPDLSSVIALKDSSNSITDKGFIQFIKIAGISGYFFNDDPTLTSLSSDYSSISWNRVINKAHRIAYTALIKKQNDDVDIDVNTGKIESSVISDWESDVESAIRAQMMKTDTNTVKEISGVKCSISADSDIVNDQVDAVITIVRKGQAKTINVKIGFGETLPS